ncbi:1,4-dihydroxy-6-naphthoate synthase [Abditibacterium utsteinense]|uniref:1,4-dihydroxy-6-naphtoate synthase n=1 Tax=Abditibacterium utsteinense TaxID=1960156 RepID=A0A2S8SWA1_9BACT|nr:MqnA/MqnD/SBP family protein [Abditibacterium utsteinense]PQV65081.1 1,4-dihydroxy-6-naphthoate synthase [Abditibacterium utsteinense]
MPQITVAHSPDSDDAFMHYALAEGKIDAGDIEFRHVLRDIESLNHAASDGIYEVTALSIHAYALLSDKYALLNHGASMGEGGASGYGPRLIARQEFSAEQVKSQTVAIPGVLTSAYLALKLWAPQIQIVEMAFDEILPAVARGDVAAGLLIHEGQLTYGDAGLHLIADLGVWWGEQNGGLPLPLGGNAIRRDLEPELQKKVSHLLRESIAYSLAHREEALDYAMQFARGMEDDRARVDAFVGMYVNQRTLDYGDDGRRSVRLFLDKGFDAGILKTRADVEFVG